MAKAKWFWFRRIANGTVFSTCVPESYLKDSDNYEQLTKAEGERLSREQTTKELRKWLKPRTKVYTLQTHVSSSGMSRRYRVFIVREGEIRNITRSVAEAIRYTNREGEIVVGGCGFCGGFDIVQALGYALWPKGTKKPHGIRNGEPDTCGGYALNHVKL